MFRKQKVVAVTVIGLTGFCFIWFTGHNPVKFGSKAGNTIPKVLYTEEYIYTNASERPECILPSLKLWAPDQGKIKLAIEQAATHINCPLVDWTYTKNGSFFIKNEMAKKYGNISCQASYIDFVTDFKVQLRAPKQIQNGSDIEDNFFKITCKGGAETHVNFHAAAAKLPYSDVPLVKAGPDNMHILMIFFDSVSRPQWHRSLPQTVQYLTTELGGIELTGHNVLGDGTPSEIIPMLTGKDLDGPGFELKDSRRSNPKGVYVDNYPYIWNTLRKRGYIPMYSEDSPGNGLWTYQRKGFKKKPMEHYMRHFYMATKYNNGMCIGGKTSLKVAHDYLLDAFETYSPRPIFAYFHNSDLSHDSLTLLKSADGELVDFLSRLKNRGILENTLLFLASDHGPRYSILRNTKQGRYEYLSPFSSVILPPWFRQKHPQFHANLVRNAPMLTTAHDLRQTIMHVLDIEGYKRNSTRGWSLFDKIPLNRSCNISEIPSRLCSCKKWKPLPTSDYLVQQAVSTAITYINRMTLSLRGKCHEVAIKRIIDGRVALLDDNKRGDEYEVKFQTSPGNALYEIALDYQKKNEDFTMNPKNPIARTNSYASMVKCLSRSEYNVVNFCVCKGSV